VLTPREEILQHAAALFSTKGIGATRLVDVAASVGVTAPAIYYHFENLDAIVEELLTYVVEESAAFATAAATSPGSCADRLASLLTQHVERLTAAPYDLWFVTGLSEEESRRFPSIRSKARQWRHAVADLVVEGTSTGEFREVDVDLAVAAIAGMVEGALGLRHSRSRVAPAEVAALAVAAIRR
jgi:AcrR family transcriptional regulator